MGCSGQAQLQLDIVLILYVLLKQRSSPPCLVKYWHAQLTVINKAKRNLKTNTATSIDLVDLYETIPENVIKAIIDPNRYQDEVDINLWVDSQNLENKEKLFLQLKLEGLTMEEISDDLGESAYKVRQGLREKLQKESDEDA